MPGPVAALGTASVTLVDAATSDTVIACWKTLYAMLRASVFLRVCKRNAPSSLFLLFTASSSPLPRPACPPLLCLPRLPVTAGKDAMPVCYLLTSARRTQLLNIFRQKRKRRKGKRNTNRETAFRAVRKALNTEEQIGVSGSILGLTSALSYSSFSVFYSALLLLVLFCSIPFAIQIQAPKCRRKSLKAPSCVCTGLPRTAWSSRPRPPVSEKR